MVLTQVLMIPLTIESLLCLFVGLLIIEWVWNKRKRDRKKRLIDLYHKGILRVMDEVNISYELHTGYIVNKEKKVMVILDTASAYFLYGKNFASSETEIWMYREEGFSVKIIKITHDNIAEALTNLFIQVETP